MPFRGVIIVRAVETDKEMFDLEKLRQEVFNIKGLNVNETAAFKEIKNKRALGIACYEDEKIVSGCILTGSRKNLYIDWLFTDKKYRKKGKLLNY